MSQQEKPLEPRVLNTWLYTSALTHHRKQTKANATIGLGLAAILVGTVGSLEWDKQLGPYGTSYVLYAGVFLMAVAAVLAIGFGDRASFERDMMEMLAKESPQVEMWLDEYDSHKTPRSLAMKSGIIAAACMLMLASQAMHGGDISLHNTLNQALFIAIGVSLALMTLSAFLAFKRHEDKRRSLSKQNYTARQSVMRFFAPTSLAVIGANSAGLGLYLISQGMQGPGTGFVLAGIATVTFALIVKSLYDALEEFSTDVCEENFSIGEDQFNAAQRKAKILRTAGTVSSLAAMGAGVDISDKLLTASAYHPSLLNPSLLVFVISVAFTLAMLIGTWGIRKSVEDAREEGCYHQNYFVAN